MSAKIMGLVWDLVLTPAKQTVLLALADHADHNGNNVKPGVPLVAWKTGYSERQVQRIMKDLEADSLLIMVREVRGKPTIYRIDISAGTPKQPFVPRKRGDKMSPVKMSGVTSQAKRDVIRGDIASANLSSIRQSTEPSVVVQPNIFYLYEKWMGLTITPGMKDVLELAAETYPSDWIEDALIETGKKQKRSWSYTEAILKRWQSDGRHSKLHGGGAAASGNRQPDYSVPEFDAVVELSEAEIEVRRAQVRADKERFLNGG